MSGESFVPHMRQGRVCWESFVPHMRWGRVCWESFVPDMRWGRVSGESFVPEVGRPWVLLLGFCCSWALGPGLPGPQVRSTTVAVGVLHDTKPSCGVSPACRALVSCNSPRVVARARDLRGCGRQSADPLGDKSPKATVLAEWDCALVDVVSVVVYWSHANPLFGVWAGLPMLALAG